MLPLSVQKLERRNGNVNRIVEALNISDISDKYPSELSGGQRQRTSTLRHSLIYLQLYLLMNQPTGALDSKSTQDLLKD